MGDKADLFPEKGDKSITLNFNYATTMPLYHIANINRQTFTGRVNPFVHPKSSQNHKVQFFVLKVLHQDKVTSGEYSFPCNINQIDRSIKICTAKCWYKKLSQEAFFTILCGPNSTGRRPAIFPCASQKPRVAP